MVLLDALVRCDGPEVVCTVTIRPDAPFVVDGRVPALVAIEYFAQAVAAMQGYLARDRPGGLAMGMLVGARNLELLCDYFAVGDHLTVIAHEVWSDANLAQFRCELLRDHQTVARANINVHRGAPPS